MTVGRILTLVPVRSFHDGKSRLSGALGPLARRNLIKEMLDHVLACVHRVDLLDCHVVSSDPDVLDHARRSGVKVAPVAGDGLNCVLEKAAAILGQETSVLTLHADLPLLQADDLEVMIALAQTGHVVAGPDQFMQGTNALLMSDSRRLPYLFGQNSLARFVDAAKNAGMRMNICRRPGLAFDVDTEADLAALSTAILPTAAFRCKTDDVEGSAEFQYRREPPLTFT